MGELSLHVDRKPYEVVTSLNLLRLDLIVLGELTSGIQFGASSEHGSASFRCLLDYNTFIRLNKTDSL